VEECYLIPFCRWKMRYYLFRWGN